MTTEHYVLLTILATALMMIATLHYWLPFVPAHLIYRGF